ncbi:MAG: acyltransferase family protein [Patescibacteria group bacterium]
MNDDINLNKQSKNKVLGLSLAKALGIILILTAHINQVVGENGNSRYKIYHNHFIERWLYVLGYYGVSLFIVASGFGLAYSLIIKNERISLSWIYRRFKKIYIYYSG